MALSDITRRVITEFSADVSRYVTSLGEAKDKVAEFGAGVGEMAKEANESLNSVVESLGKFNQAFEGLNKIVEFGAEGLKAYGDELRLTAAAGSTDIEQLSESFAGLRNEHELLSFAAKAQHGVLQLTQEQMNKVGEAVTSLTRQGFDQSEAFDKVTSAAISLKTKGLDKLGISVQKGATDAETLDNVMSALGKTIEKGAGLAETESDRVQQLSVSWANAKEKVDTYIGAALMSVDMTPEGIERARKKQHDIDNPEAADLSGINSESTIPVDNDPFTSVGKAFGMVGDAVNDPWRHSQDTLTAYMEAAKKKYDVALAQGKEAAAGVIKYHQELQKSIDEMKAEIEKYKNSDDYKAAEAQRGSLGTKADDDYGTIGTAASAEQDANIKKTFADMSVAHAKIDTEVSKQKTSMAEKMFGKVDDINLIRDAFKGLTDGVSAGYKAMVDGSMGFGDAAKLSVEKTLEAEGSKMQVLALENLGYGFAAAASGPIGGTSAGSYFAAAAEFEAGAILAGVAAHELGGGKATASSSSSSSGTSSSSAGAAAANSNAPTGTSTNTDTSINPNGAIIVIGDDYATGSSRMRALRAKKLVAAATGSAGSGAVNT